MARTLRTVQKSSAKPAGASSLQRPGPFSSLTQKVKLWEKHCVAKVTIFVETYPPLLGFHVSGTSRLWLTASVLSKYPAAVLSLSRG